MEHMNNDMDDLFRKAGELYPLKTTESDWDGVLGKLREEGLRDHQAGTGLNSVKKRRWLLLMLLIPLGLFSIVYFSGTKKEQIPVSKPITAKSDPTLKNNPAENSPSKSDMRADPDPIKTAAVNQGVNQDEQLNRKVSGKSLPSLPANVSSLNDPDSKKGNVQKNVAPGAQMKTDFRSSGVNKITDEKAISNKDKNFADASPSNPESFHEPMKKTFSLSTNGPNEIASVYGMPFSLGSTRLVTLKSLPSETVVKTNSNKTQNSKGLYIGFLAGPDLSSVDFQSIKQPGFSLGLLAGYRFNKRLAIETGLLWDKKYYYSDGAHFDKSGTSIPYYVTVRNANGNCNMFEIPLAIRYDFASNNNHGFFVKAGLSSYLMKKENYTLNSDSSGYPYPPYALDYNKARNYIFSIIQLSAGYELAIGNKTKIRIEPYLKIPLQGIGAGKMPVSSAGFYLGISHSFR
jgi:hypothetical protein